MRRLIARYAALVSQFLRFGVVGVAGFLVDAGTLTLMMAAGLGPYGGRVLSYLAAASTTFALNRAWTFRSVPAGARLSRQWGLFLALNLVGFAVNYGTYAALLATVPLVAAHPVLGVAAGSVAGMFSNFALSRRYVFRAA
ncbi:MAG: GtrA family protein [Acetobacteraceae bacterium]|nr:GtrA family protein [Acetobacteraceae bacterium]